MKSQPPAVEQFPFFVYGTLLPNQPNYYLLDGFVVRQEVAVLPNGRLHDFGHYPMLVEGGGMAIKGVVVTVLPEMYDKVLNRLDILEGYDPVDPDRSFYLRVMREVDLGNGRWQSAWVYLGREASVTTQPIVADGDWASHIACKGRSSNY